MTVRRRFVIRGAGDPAEVAVESRDGRRVNVRVGDTETAADLARLPDGRASVILASGRQLTGRATATGSPDGAVDLQVGAIPVLLDLADPLRALAGETDHGAAGASEIRAQIPGRVVEVRVEKGEVVAAGSTLLVLEAMKMQNEIRAGANARVTSVECAPGLTVEKGQILVRLETTPVS